MSAISQSVQLIQAAIKTHAKVVSLLGWKITVNDNAGIFIIMNPAAKGQGGRQKLPDNLKQLFRPVAMNAPDNRLFENDVCRGFQECKDHGSTHCGVVLAVKAAAFYAASLQVRTPFAEIHLSQVGCYRTTSAITMNHPTM